MRLERWFSQNRTYEIVRDKERGLLLENHKQLSMQQKQDLLDSKGKPIEQVRHEMVKAQAEKTITIPPLKLERYFQENGDFENAEKVRETNLQNLTSNARSLLNEAAFVGESFMEGFLGFYGIELNKAVENYERRLQAYEEINLVTGEKNVFVAQLANGAVKKLSPNLQSLDIANNKINDYQKTLEAKGLKQSPELKLQQKIEEEG